jgi:hypothetical protein
VEGCAIPGIQQDSQTCNKQQQQSVSQTVRSHISDEQARRRPDTHNVSFLVSRHALPVPSNNVITANDTEGSIRDVSQNLMAELRKAESYFMSCYIGLVEVRLIVLGV